MHAKSVARQLITASRTPHTPRPTGAATIDANVTDAVTSELDRLCAEFVAYSRSLDPTFATEVAERLVAFTQRRRPHPAPVPVVGHAGQWRHGHARGRGTAHRRRTRTHSELRPGSR